MKFCIRTIWSLSLCCLLRVLSWSFPHLRIENVLFPAHNDNKHFRRNQLKILSVPARACSFFMFFFLNFWPFINDKTFSVVKMWWKSNTYWAIVAIVCNLIFSLCEHVIVLRAADWPDGGVPSEGADPLHASHLHPSGAVGQTGRAQPLPVSSVQDQAEGAHLRVDVQPQNQGEGLEVDSGRGGTTSANIKVQNVLLSLSNQTAFCNNFHIQSHNNHE